MGAPQGNAIPRKPMSKLSSNMKETRFKRTLQQARSRGGRDTSLRLLKDSFRKVRPEA